MVIALPSAFELLGALLNIHVSKQSPRPATICLPAHTSLACNLAPSFDVTPANQPLSTPQYRQWLPRAETLSPPDCLQKFAQVADTIPYRHDDDVDVDQRTQCPPPQCTQTQLGLGKALFPLLLSRQHVYVLTPQLRLSPLFKYLRMYFAKKTFAFALTWLLATTRAADLSYNGLAVTPQMGWVRQLAPTTGSPAD